MKYDESKTQANIIKAANKYKRFYLFMIKNDGAKSQQQAMRDTAMGLRSGVADLGMFDMVTKLTYYLEIKTEKGIQSPNQLKFQELVGDLYHILRSVDDFELFVKSIIS